MEKTTVTIEIISKLWPVFVFISAIIWKQIITHFEVKSLTKDLLKTQKTIDVLEHEFQTELKDHVVQNKGSIDKLTEAITELIKTTTILATKIELKERKYP